MRTAITALAASMFAVALGSTAAMADECKSLITKEWMPIERAISKAESLGYSVKEAKRKGGCWEVEGFDRNGAEIEIKLNAANGDVVKPSDYRAPN